MRVLVTGASGFIGRQIVAALLEAGHTVTAGARQPEALRRRWPSLPVESVDFAQDHTPAVWLPRLRNMDVVVNAVGIFQEQGRNTFQALHRDAPIALFQACVAAGVKRVIQISALGADAQAQSAFHLSKRAADDFLVNSELDWAILYPSVVYGPGEGSMALFKAMAALPVLPLIGDGQQPLQPIHVEDLSRGLAALVANAAPLRQRVPAVGPQSLSFSQLLASLRAWLGLRRTIPISLTPTIAIPGAALAGRAGLAPVNGDAMRMLLRGNTAPPSLFSTPTGITPRSLTAHLAAQPATQADRWHAGLYFLRPLLRLAIAFVWIATGIISIFFYPHADSYQLLAATGIHGILAPVALYGASLLDLALGVATLFRYQIRWTAWLQILVMLLFSLMIALYLPQYWLHPYGPLIKNIPLMVATLVMLVLETK